MTQRSVWKETGVYYQGSNLGGDESTPARSPSLPQDLELPLLPKRPQAKNTLRMSPFPYLSLSQSHQQIPILSGMCTCGSGSPSSHRSSLLQNLGYTALSPCSSLGTLCCATLDHVSQMLEPREAHTPAGEPVSRSGLPSSAGSKPLVGPTSPSPTSRPICAGEQGQRPGTSKC